MRILRHQDAVGMAETAELLEAAEGIEAAEAFQAANFFAEQMVESYAEQ